MYAFLFGGTRDMKKLFSLCLAVILSISVCACSPTSKTNPTQAAETQAAASSTAVESTAAATSAAAAESSKPTGISYKDASLPIEDRVKDLLSQMTLEEKAGQMVQGVIGTATAADVTTLGLGSILSGGGAHPGDNSIKAWQDLVQNYQEAAMKTRLQIPFIYGIDSVHGHNTVYGAVVYPQNIGLGAANDPELMYQMGAAVAEEMKLTHTLWNFSPCVAVVQDPRWGRSYESFSSDPLIVSSLASAYVKGQADHGILSTAKHYAGDGGTLYGTGEGSNLIDRGDVQISAEDFETIHLAPYKALIDAGVRVVMASFSSYQGTKMTENKYYLTDVLKGEYGFTGFVVSDWEATAGLSESAFKDQVAAAVNAGIDMFMEPYKYSAAVQAIIDGVNDGIIPQERVDDAVSRILTVKFEMGLFEDPYMENLKTEQTDLGCDEYRLLAKTLVEESLVLLKNDSDVLPLKSGQKIYVTGPALNDIGVQCGGWTMTWQGITDKDNGGRKITEGTTILEGLQEYADKNGFEIITDPARASEADAVILAIGEKPYAEFEGDSEDLSLESGLGLSGNSAAIAEAKKSGKPVIALIVAGREVDIDSYMDDWSAAVMCFLPGSEGDGVAAVLSGESPFAGKLPMPWYKDVTQIGTEYPEILFPLGYGLTY